MSPAPHRNSRKRRERFAPSNLTEAVEAILKKGTVVEAFVRYSPLDVELATMDGWYRIQGLDEYSSGRGQAQLGHVGEEHDEKVLARLAELEGMDRDGLKAVLRKADRTFKVLKRYSDDDLRDAILNREFPA